MQEKPHQKAFHEELEFLMQQFREGCIKSVHDLMKLIDMAYNDYLDFHPEDIPEYHEYRERTKHDSTESGPISKESR